MTTVAGKVKKVTFNAIGIIDGSTEKTSNGRTRPKLFWLPKSQISVEPEDYDIDSDVTIELPAWLAVQEGLE
jgi:hypothetical protein